MSDKIIWNNLRNGDQKALETIYRTYFSELFNYGKKFSKDINTVEDSIQELFVELWNRRSKLSETDAIKPYLFVSLRRKILHSIKKIRKVTDNELKESHFDAVLSIDQIIIDRESGQKKKDKLKNAFEQLSYRQKEILYLKFYSEMSYDEISEVMDMNYQSARNLVSRALAKLSKVILLYLFLVGAKYIFN